ncbi:MAG: methionine--tRNA ligase [Deltaproteobacteria bacterium]|nr:methionine--tRNA ligase [Candidatus Zymogenaceae bacterium]
MTDSQKDNRFYITTPIYYVNAAPHIGHAYTTIVADVVTRYKRLTGAETFFLTGTDEHGDKVMRAAAAKGVSPKQYADEISGLFKGLWVDLMITNDRFIRTTDPDHIGVVQSILQKVYDSGDIYFAKYGGLYCVGCERFYTERELVDGKCPDHDTTPEYIEESNYFFRMSTYQDRLIDHITGNPDFIRPERYRNEVLSFLKEPLEDLCISRPKTRISWGIELPFDDKYVCYVWFDALINYLTGLGYPDDPKFKKFWPVCRHLTAKDIIKPHGIYWPTMLMAAGIPLYQSLNVHGYWTIEASKMSKSLGNIVNPLSLKDKYGLDAFRYYLMREMSFGLDSSFSEEALVARLNADLANDLGNLVNRALTMAAKYFDSRVPDPKDGPGPTDGDLVETAARVRADYIEGMEGFAFHKALIAVWELVSLLNRYIVENQPWELAKTEETAGRLSRVIYNTLEGLRFLGVFLVPFMPGTAEKILTRLGVGTTAAVAGLDSTAAWGGLAGGLPITVAEALFPRVDASQTIVREEAKKMEVHVEPIVADLISYEEFQKIDLRLGIVTAAEAVPKSEKLIKMTVDIGEERTIVAGIGKQYTPEQMVGRRIVVVANLKPAKLMGVESRGMLLAVVDEKEGLSLVTVDKEAAPGGRLS